MRPFLDIVAIGIGATVLADAWALLRRRLWGVALPDWALVGRWFAHLTRGRFVHAPIAASAPVRLERAIGWIAHYAVGITFAALLVAACGSSWLRAPTLAPALAFGIASVAAPWFVLQPGMGLGVFARRAKQPGPVRLHSFLTHLVFGFGLYVAALLLSLA